MINNNLKYLCCPKCKADLVMSESQLICSGTNCKGQFDIKQGIPVLIDLNNLPSHLSNQVNYFEKGLMSEGEGLEYFLKEWQRNYIERFNMNFQSISNKLIVDCGTGTGYMAVELAKKGAHLIACDLTFKSLVRLKNIIEKLSLSDKFTLACCSADNLPFKNGIADFFILNAVLEHIPNESLAIHEINRVCKLSAGMMITVPLSYKYLNPLLIPINYIHDKRIGHLRRYDDQILSGKFNNWSLLRSYFTGHFSKVLKVLFNIVMQVFDEVKIEKIDKKNEHSKWGASNVIVMFERVKK